MSPRRPACSRACGAVAAVAVTASLLGGIGPAAAQTRPAATGPTPARAARGPGVPASPRELRFAPLAFTPPDAARHRRVLANKVVAYLVEDHALPLVTVTVLMRGGSFLDPSGKAGLAALAGAQMRAGGTASLTAEEFDEEVDFLAANVSSGFGGTSGSASVNFLAKDADRALGLFFEMLRQPRFQADRLELAKAQTLQAMERRNDATDDIEGREWARLLRGPSHFTTAWTTKASVDAITREDLVAFHHAYVHPGNFIFAVSGDFDPADMAARLERAMDGWAPSGTPVPPVPKPDFTPVPGVYVVNKPEVNQGRVSLGHLGIVRGDPDEIALDLMNEILGGSGFTSRITRRVRSDEGLAYDAASGYSAGIYYPGTFHAGFQSKSPSVARATQIVLEEIARIREAPVTAEELDTVKTYAVEVFPRYFASATAVAATFAGDELTGRDPAFWRTYRDRVRAVTADDILRVARQHLHPDRLVVLAVGNVDDMLKGDPDHPGSSLETIAKGPITRIPLPDPLTMVYSGGG